MWCLVCACVTHPLRKAYSSGFRSCRINIPACPKLPSFTIFLNHQRLKMLKNLINTYKQRLLVLICNSLSWHCHGILPGVIPIAHAQKSCDHVFFFFFAIPRAQRNQGESFDRTLTRSSKLMVCAPFFFSLFTVT